VPVDEYTDSKFHENISMAVFNYATNMAHLKYTPFQTEEKLPRLPPTTKYDVFWRRMPRTGVFRNNDSTCEYFLEEQELLSGNTLNMNIMSGTRNPSNFLQAPMSHDGIMSKLSLPSVQF
jgi:hypothetical protein